MNLTTGRTALSNAIDNVSGINVTPMTDNPDLDAVIIHPKTPFEWRDTFDDHATPTFAVLILVAYTDTDPAQDRLDSLIVLVAAAAETVAGASVVSLADYTPLLLEDGRRCLSAELHVEFR